MLARFVRPALFLGSRPLVAASSRFFAALSYKIDVNAGKDEKSKLFKAVHPEAADKIVPLPLPDMTFSTLQQLRQESNKYIIADKIMRVPGVSEIRCAPEGVDVELDEPFSWDSVEPQVIAAIDDGMSEITKQIEEEVVEAIKYLIDVKIKPVLHGDGGDIKFEGFNDGVVSVSLHGACKGCPSSAITLKQGVEKYIKTYIPQVSSVERIDDVDETIPVTKQEIDIAISGNDPATGEGETKTFLG